MSNADSRAGICSGHASGRCRNASKRAPADQHCSDRSAVTVLLPLGRARRTGAESPWLRSLRYLDPDPERSRGRSRLSPCSKKWWAKRPIAMLAGAGSRHRRSTTEIVSHSLSINYWSRSLSRTDTSSARRPPPHSPRRVDARAAAGRARRVGRHRRGRTARHRRPPRHRAAGRPRHSRRRASTCSSIPGTPATKWSGSSAVTSIWPLPPNASSAPRSGPSRSATIRMSC